MNNKMKKIFLIFGVVTAILVLAAIIFVSTFDINSYRSGIQAAASGATGLEVKINGKMGLSFFPFGVSARDVHVTNQGSEILSVEDLKMGADWMPLLKKQLKVTSCELVKPVFFIVKGADGKYNYKNTGQVATIGQI